MGLFGKLFEKKICDICGGEIGLLGNRKLEDGNLCKSCAGKLSPWFDERRHSTVEQIREQLEYREQNKEAVASFNISRTLGKYTRIHLDEKAGKFMVTSAKNPVEANPDVLALTQITGCDYEINENRHEEKRTVKDAEGKSKQVSYVPPHYIYSYDFRIKIGVNAPYFNDISFNLNNTSVKIQSVGEMKIGASGRKSLNNQSFSQVAAHAAKQGIREAVTKSANADPRMTNLEYAQYYNMCNEIKDCLLQARRGNTADTVSENTIPETPDAAQSKVSTGPMICPFCTATTTPDKAGNCEYCGSKIR